MSHCTQPGCGQPLTDHYGGIGCLPGRAGGRVINRTPFAPTEVELRGHLGHSVSATPSVTDDGWDARVMRCDDCRDQWVETRAMPAEGTLIDPDPHR